jgi:hypothetical protein
MNYLIFEFNLILNMGTKALVRFISKKEKVKKILVCFYFQYDGYLEGVGLSLAKFLNSRIVCNGIPFDKAPDNKIYANGLGCLAAQYCQENKSEPGNFYIFPTDWTNEEYTYDVFYDEIENTFKISVNDSKKMSLVDFTNYCENQLE